MATNTQRDVSSAEDSERECRIDLTDIRGVGERVREYLHEAGVNGIEEVHLLRERSRPAYQTLISRGVSAATLSHLQAVGGAAHYTGGSRVEAKHLTTAEAKETPDHSFVAITESARLLDGDTDADAPDETQETLDECEQYDPDVDAISDALGAIRQEYDRGMDGQTSFHADLGRHVYESGQFDNDDFPLQVVQSVVRYQHDVETLTAQRDYEPRHGSMLVSFAETL